MFTILRRGTYWWTREWNKVYNLGKNCWRNLVSKPLYMQTIITHVLNPPPPSPQLTIVCQVAFSSSTLNRGMGLGASCFSNTIERHIPMGVIWRLTGHSSQVALPRIVDNTLNLLVVILDIDRLEQDVSCDLYLIMDSRTRIFYTFYFSLLDQLFELSHQIQTSKSSWLCGQTTALLL